MLSIRDGEALSRALRSDIDHRIKRLLIQRSDELGGDLSDAHFAIVEPADTPAIVERTLGLMLVSDDALRPDWVEAHDFCFEAVFDLTQAFTQVLLVPNHAHIDARIRTFCADFASERPSASERTR